jgi:hypothetical protein
MAEIAEIQGNKQTALLRAIKVIMAVFRFQKKKITIMNTQCITIIKTKSIE